MIPSAPIFGALEMEGPQEIGEEHAVTAAEAQRGKPVPKASAKLDVSLLALVAMTVLAPEISGPERAEGGR